MRYLRILLLLAIITSYYGCNKKHKQPINKAPIPERKSQKKLIKKEKTAEKTWDSLNRNNVNAFFTEYGKQNKETIVIIKTDFGNIKIRLYNDTPIHRANFIFLSKIGYFDTTVFYRVSPNFVIQAGNSERKDAYDYRKKYRFYKLPPEFLSHRRHKYGAIAAARDWNNNPKKMSNGFQFYIIQNRNGGHHLNNEHTVFGEVISGFSTIDKISRLETTSDEWPKIDVPLKVKVIR